MKAYETNLPGVLLLEPKVIEDERGFFLESYNERIAMQAGILERFVQDNHSRSVKNVLRGLHYQENQPQGKLIRTLVGAVFDVAVDIRLESPTFGHWFGTILSAENKRLLWIPPGLAHGFCVLTDAAEVFYKVTDFYAPHDERILIWNDPEIGIDWPLSEPPILSPKDRQGQTLSQIMIPA